APAPAPSDAAFPFGPVDPNFMGGCVTYLQRTGRTVPKANPATQGPSVTVCISKHAAHHVGRGDGVGDSATIDYTVNGPPERAGRRDCRVDIDTQAWDTTGSYEWVSDPAIHGRHTCGTGFHHAWSVAPEGGATSARVVLMLWLDGQLANRLMVPSASVRLVG